MERGSSPESGTDNETLNLAKVLVRLKSHGEWRKGLTKPQLHYYIESKQALYDELLYALLEAWSAAFAFDPALDDPAQIIGNYVRRKLDYALDNPALSRIFTNEVLGGGLRLHQYWPVALSSTAQKVDLEAIRAAGHPTATALIVTNSDDLPEISVVANGDAAAGTPVFKFKK